MAPLDDSFCISHYYLCAITSIAIIFFHGLFRKSQKIHILLTKISKLELSDVKNPNLRKCRSTSRQISYHRDRDTEFFELLGQYTSNIELSEICQNGISNLKLEISKISSLPETIIDIILSYCYEIKSNVVYYSITKPAMTAKIESRFKTLSKFIEIYCYIRIIFIIITYIILLYEFSKWHIENKPNFLNGCVGYVFVMIYHPVYKGTIVRIWNGYNGTNLYLPKIVRISISIDAFILLSIQIIHIFQLFVAAVIFIIWTIGLILYFVIQRRIEQPQIQEKIKKRGWIIEEIVYFLKMYISLVVLIVSIWLYTVAIVEFFNRERNWSSSFTYAAFGNYCTDITVNIHDWKFTLLLIAWMVF